MELELVLIKICLSPAANLPRKTRLSTRTGRKKRGEVAIEPERSLVRPPAGTIEWMWGRRCRFCPRCGAR